MNAMTKATQGRALTTGGTDRDVREALKNSLYPGASDASVDMVLSYCSAAGLDPMTKPVHIVPMKVSTGKKDNRGWDIKENRDVVMPGIGLYRINAARTGQYAGCSEPEYGPTRTMHYKAERWEDVPGSDKRRKTYVDAALDYPEWCRVTVRKLLGATVVEFTATEYWLENYASKGDDDAPNAMWAKRPFGQLAKCAEAQALRKAFPEAVGSQPTAEEMEGKDIDGYAARVEPAGPAMPQPKAIATEPDAGQVVDGEFTETAAGEPGIHDLSDSQRRILSARAKAAGLDTAEALLAKYPRIDLGNLNDVLAALRKVAG